MRYEMMFPEDTKKAIEENIPVVLPVGVLEYHADHLPSGVDGLLVEKAVELAEKEVEIVVLPAFYYGTASSAIGPISGSGTLDIKADSVHLFALSLFENLLKAGFRNIHVFLHHQTENFAGGMPTDLAFKFAGKKAVFSLLEREMGEGWWGNEAMRDYYESHAAGKDPFSWIRVHPLMDEETQNLFPIDHAGKQETSLMLAFCPGAVKQDRMRRAGKWFAETAAEASLEYGEKAKDMIVKKMVKMLEASL